VLQTPVDAMHTFSKWPRLNRFTNVPEYVCTGGIRTVVHFVLRDFVLAKCLCLVLAAQFDSVKFRHSFGKHVAKVERVAMRD
jgi:hypothetical protein